MDAHPQGFPFGIMDVVELLHLKVRRRQADSAYVDCPFCGDCRGKMNVNFVKNVWRCNYCGEGGGMLALYAGLNGTTGSGAYREICDALQAGDTSWGYERSEMGEACAGSRRTASPPPHAAAQGIPQAARASAQEIHDTLSALLGMLPLSAGHRAHLRSGKRGLTDGQIDRLGFRSTPPRILCRTLTERLLGRGFTVEGVPGFYLHGDGYWTAKFSGRTSGILIPAVGIDGLLQGVQILLDTPIKDKGDPPDKAGTKYIWLSSSNRNMGVTSGSPVHFIGDPSARTVYVTEGFLKADIAHCLTDRTFAAVAGANNVGRLDALFARLAQNGTRLVVEAYDMDKLRNRMIAAGASKIYMLAARHGLECRHLTWNPDYKGVDDWQLALRERRSGGRAEISGRLSAVKCRSRRFRIYRLDMGAGGKSVPSAFRGIQMRYGTGHMPHGTGHMQPHAADYRLVEDSALDCPENCSDMAVLERIRSGYGGCAPGGCCGRTLAPSDVVELYDGQGRNYFYVDTKGFEPVRFSPFLAKPMEGRELMAG